MRIKLSHLLVGLVVLTFIACSKEVSYEINPNAAVAGNFRANINGVQWIAMDTAQGASILGGLISIFGISSGKGELRIALDDSVPRVYKLDQGSYSYAAYLDLDSADNYAYFSNQGRDTSQGGGTVTVTEIDKVHKTISGVFSLKLYRNADGKQKVIKQGVFSKLSYSTSLPPANNSDTMRASLNGSPWVAKSIAVSALGGNLIISGSLADGSKSIALLLSQIVSPGSYPLSFTGAMVGVYNPQGTLALASESGTLVILENNTSTKRVRGTFSFHAADPTPGGSMQTANITNGYFSVKHN
jgi:hypothetical protein